jgi:4-amino-4-deoxy-L-arabinose transferase-like glycosyltransferase
MYALLIFAVALAARLIHVWQLKGSPFFDTLLGDANGYDLWAQRLAAGDWIGSEVFYQAPLYPYFVGVVYALFGRDLLIVRVVQALIGSASCVLLGLAGARLFSTRVGLAAGLALALWAPAIFFDAVLQKSVLDMFFMCRYGRAVADTRKWTTARRRCPRLAAV